MTNSFLSVLSRAINAYLHLDTESAGRLAALDGKTISIELLPFHFAFQCRCTRDGIELQRGEHHPAETKITGTPLQMMNVVLTKDKRHQFFAEDLVMEGNAELGQQIISLFDELQLDQEECLAHVIGDVPAYHVNKLAQGLKNWFIQTEQTLTQDVNEYLHEECGWLPTHEALNDFFDDIDHLRMDVDRIEAKIKQLSVTAQ